MRGMAISNRRSRSIRRDQSPTFPPFHSRRHPAEEQPLLQLSCGGKEKRRRAAGGGALPVARE